MSDDYYVVLHHAKKNIGDFLIRDRAKRLLEFVRPDRKLIEFSSWLPLDDHLETLNGAKAVILMGGPGLQGLYPESYPLIKNLDDLKVPLVLMGIGSYFRVFDKRSSDHFKFSKSTREFINRVEYIGVRDSFTKNTLDKQGITATMTGCPVWYNVDKFNKPIDLSNNKSLVFTPPANMLFKNQCLEIMNWIAEAFPDHKVYTSYNRGYTADKFTTKAYEVSIKPIVDRSEELGFENVDTSYDMDKIDFYQNCDLHIGYRLHSHIHFMSRRAPSFLISEDARSCGYLETIGLPFLQGEKTNIFSGAFLRGNRYVQYAISRFFSPVSPNEKLPAQLANVVKREIDTGYLSFRGIDNKLDWAFESKMKPFLESLP